MQISQWVFPIESKQNYTHKKQKYLISCVLGAQNLVMVSLQYWSSALLWQIFLHFSVVS
jgi:hypothetical protein